MAEISPVRVFISYSHADDALRKRLERHLVTLKNQGVVDIWSDRQIDAGSEWEPNIYRNLETAEIILLLVSPDFLASDFCQQKELKRAMERHDAREARVIPVFLRPCNWKGAVFGRLQGVPEDAKPVTSFGDRDKAFTIIAEAIAKAATDLRAPPPARERGIGERETSPKRPASSPGADSAAKAEQPPPFARRESVGGTAATADPGLGESPRARWEPPRPASPSGGKPLFSSQLFGEVSRVAGRLVTRAKTYAAPKVLMRGRPAWIVLPAAALLVILTVFSIVIRPRLEIEEYEPNDIFSSSTQMSVGQSAVGKIADGKDVDFFKVRVPEDFSGSVDILLNNLSGPDGFVPEVTVYDESFEKIKDSSASTKGSYLAFVLPVKKGVRFFYVSVANSRYVGGGAGPYKLSVLRHS